MFGLLLLVGCITELPELDDPCGPVEKPGLYKLTLDDEGRKVLIDLPSTEGPRPLVVMLHGYGSSAARMKDVTNFGGVGRDEGFVTVFPNGTGGTFGMNKSWNAGWCCSPESRAVDDVAYLDKVIALVEERVCADPDRTYVAGHSNGGMMALRLACETDRIEGVVSAAGFMMQDECENGPVPAMFFHGLADPVIEYDGGQLVDQEYPSSDESLAVLLRANDCDPEPVRVEVGAAVCEEYDCAVPTRRCTIETWDHRWAGGLHSRAASYDLTRQAWSFFKGEPLPSEE